MDVKIQNCYNSLTSSNRRPCMCSEEVTEEVKEVVTDEVTEEVTEEVTGDAQGLL